MPQKNPDFKPITLSDIHDEDIEKEHMGKVRKIALTNGNHVWIECVDPFGFWKVKLKKGQLPDFIRNNTYTTFLGALNDVNRWLENRKEAIVYTTDQIVKAND